MSTPPPHLASVAFPSAPPGKVVTLLSSGFDSPVSTWMVGRRGAICVPVHFSGRPMTADTSEWLCQDIVDALAPSGTIGRLYVVPFGERQREISLAVPQSLRIIMYRRVMLQVAERIALLEGAKALVTGESLGQVASQTLENIAAVNEAVTMPVLRPLIGSDKQEIIARAHEIGTYDISCQTAPDCCTLFMPRRPETHAAHGRRARCLGELRPRGDGRRPRRERRVEGLPAVPLLSRAQGCPEGAPSGPRSRLRGER